MLLYSLKLQILKESFHTCNTLLEKATLPLRYCRLPLKYIMTSTSALRKLCSHYIVFYSVVFLTGLQPKIATSPQTLRPNSRYRLHKLKGQDEVSYRA